MHTERIKSDFGSELILDPVEFPPDGLLLLLLEVQFEGGEIEGWDNLLISGTTGMIVACLSVYYICFIIHVNPETNCGGVELILQ